MIVGGQTEAQAQLSSTIMTRAYIIVSQNVKVYMEGQNMNLPRIKMKSKILQKQNEQPKKTLGWVGGKVKQ